MSQFFLFYVGMLFQWSTLSVSSHYVYGLFNQIVEFRQGFESYVKLSKKPEFYFLSIKGNESVNL